MNLAVIGFGNAGGKIADRLLAFERETGRSLSAFSMAVNAAAIDLEKLEVIPEAKRLLIGQTHEQVKGRGAGADPELGAEVTRQDLNEIERARWTAFRSTPSMDSSWWRAWAAARAPAARQSWPNASARPTRNPSTVSV